MAKLASETIRPSNLLRRERCPGSLGLESSIPASESSESSKASKGNRLHDEIAKAIISHKDRVIIIAESEEPEIVKACVDEAERCWNSLTPAQQKRAKILIEKEVDLTCLDMENGTPDFAIVVPDSDAESGLVVLRDWKSGQGWVASARWNLQLLAYAVGLCKQYGIKEGVASIGIFQPLVRTYADVWTATQQDLASVADKIRHIVEVCTKWDSPPIIPGGHCVYCRAQGRCEARCMVAAEVKQIANPIETFKALDPKRRKSLYDNIGKALKILESVRDEIDASILKGEIEVAGYGIGEGRKGRFWSVAHPIEMLAAIATRKGLTLEDVVEPISVSAAEKLLGKKEVEGFIAVKIGNPAVKAIKAK